MKSKYHFSFEDLKVYQKAMGFGELVLNQLKKFPKIKAYRLSSQFAGDADSIAFNIAEVTGSSDAKFLNYLGIERDTQRNVFRQLQKD